MLQLDLRAVLVLVHVLCASVWVGGHLVLAFTLLPPALKAADAATLTAFEKRFEPLAAPSLVLLLVSGLLLAMGLDRPEGAGWVGLGDLVATLVTVKLALVAATLGFALHAKLTLGELRPDTLGTYALHARAVTVLAVLLLSAGVALRLST